MTDESNFSGNSWIKWKIVLHFLDYVLRNSIGTINDKCLTTEPRKQSPYPSKIRTVQIMTLVADFICNAEHLL